MIKALLVAAVCPVVLYMVGCSVRVQGRRRPLVRAERIHGELILSTEEQKEEWETSRRKHENASSLRSEELRLRTKGDVFDYRLMSYLASVGLGVDQQTFESEAGNGSSSGNLNSYHVNMSFLPLKPYPFSIDTSKTETIAPRRFRSPLRLETTSNGFFGKLRVPDWPMTFSWNENVIDQSSDFAGNTDFFTRTTERFSYSVIHDFSERSHLDFRSDLDEISQEGVSFSRNMKTWQNRLQHDLNFGSASQHYLSSSVYLVDRTGDFESQTLSWQESLRLRHSSTFSTFYNVFYTKNTLEMAESQTLGGVVGLTHRLYDNLNTSFNVFASKSEFGGSSESNWSGGELKFDYYRNNPWGRLTSEYSARITSVESTGATGTGVVTGEPHTFTDPFPVILEKRGVVIDSIVVTNTAGTEIYTEGADGDYIVREVGDEIELVIDTADADLPNIVDGQDLLIDYLFQVDNFSEENALYQRFRIEQEFKNGVSVFYSHRSNETQLDSSRATPLSDREYKTDTFGTRYRNNYITLRAEHSDTQSNENSSQSDHLSASTFWPVTSKTSLHGRLSQTWVESRGEHPRETALFKAEAGVKSRLSKFLRLTADAELRKEDSSDFGRIEGTRFGVAVEYNRRALSLRAGYDQYFLERRNTDTATSRFYVRIIRKF